MTNASTDLPATLEIDYPDRDLDRLTSFLRPFTVIPIAIILGLVTGPTLHASSTRIGIESGGILVGATMDRDHEGVGWRWAHRRRLQKVEPTLFQNWAALPGYVNMSEVSLPW